MSHADVERREQPQMQLGDTRASSCDPSYKLCSASPSNNYRLCYITIVTASDRRARSYTTNPCYMSRTLHSSLSSPLMLVCSSQEDPSHSHGEQRHLHPNANTHRPTSHSFSPSRPLSSQLAMLLFLHASPISVRGLSSYPNLTNQSARLIQRSPRSRKESP